MLNSGADDLGGTLMEETISRMAGSEHGSAKSVSELTAVATSMARPSRIRSTTYGAISSHRESIARGMDADLARLLPAHPPDRRQPARPA